MSDPERPQLQLLGAELGLSRHPPTTTAEGQMTNVLPDETSPPDLENMWP